MNKEQLKEKVEDLLYLSQNNPFESMVKNFTGLIEEYAEYQREKVVNAAIEYADSQEPKWISVEDDLPNKEVIATDGYEIMIGYINKKLFCENDSEIMYNVTHWMPKPQLPIK